MHLLNDPPEGFDAVAKAFAMARHLPSTHRMNLVVGLARDGVLFATGTLDGSRQVHFFSTYVRELGWNERLLGGREDMFGCDMLFSPPTQRSVRDTDPSFIRRAPAELWPGTGSDSKP